MDMRLSFIAVITGAAMGLSSTAQACRLSDRQTPILHDELPALTPELVAAQVEITTDVRSLPRPPLEARIITMIHGSYSGSRM